MSKLSDNQIYEIHLRLRSGESIRSIARHIKGSYTGMSRSSVTSISKGIVKYKERIKHLFGKDLHSGREVAIGDDVDLNGIEQLEYLADRQQKRIISMMKEEESRNIINVNISKEIDSLTAFQKTIIKTKKSKSRDAEPPQSDSVYGDFIRSSQHQAILATQSMTEEAKIKKLQDAVGLVTTMLKINMGTKILGETIQDEFFKKYPSLKKLLLADSMTIESMN